MVDLFSRQIAEESSALLPMTGADCVRLEVNIRSARASTLNDQRAIEELLAQDRSPPRLFMQCCRGWPCYFGVMLINNS